MVLGRDFLVDGERLHAHVLHMCGGETILGARVEFEGTDRIICQETYGDRLGQLRDYRVGLFRGQALELSNL